MPEMTYNEACVIFKKVAARGIEERKGFLKDGIKPGNFPFRVTAREEKAMGIICGRASVRFLGREVVIDEEYCNFMAIPISRPVIAP